DGDTDFVAGNTGENSFFSNNDRHPINSYFNDFDKNGTFETVTTKYLKDKDGAYKEYTAASRDEVVDQMPFIKKKFLTYKSFATADAEDIFGKDALQKSLKLHAGYFASSYVQNLGNGKFSITPLPAMAQLAPVCAISVADFDNDNKLDVMIAGNNYGAEVFNGRMDAMNGMLLKGNGKGHFTLLPPESSGIYLPGQVNAVTIIKNIFGDLLFAACENNSALKLYVKNKINKDK
ncbi:MAG TPA: RNA-binding protein, partial [Chitinophagaceae bacterium]|nr:RNA-binding protein [Chitinophagaceae bacterium]